MTLQDKRLSLRAGITADAGCIMAPAPWTDWAVDGTVVPVTPLAQQQVKSRSAVHMPLARQVPLA